MFVDHVELTLQQVENKQQHVFPAHVVRFVVFVERALLDNSGTYQCLKPFALSWERLQRIYAVLLSEIGIVEIKIAKHQLGDDKGFDLKFVAPEIRPTITDSVLYKEFDEACVDTRMKKLQKAGDSIPWREKVDMIEGLASHNVSDDLKKELLFGKNFCGPDSASKMKYLLGSSERFRFLSAWASPEHQFHSLLPFVTGNFKQTDVKTFMRNVRMVSRFGDVVESIACPVAKPLVCDWVVLKDMSEGNDFVANVFVEIATRKLGLLLRLVGASRGRFVNLFILGFVVSKLRMCLLLWLSHFHKNSWRSLDLRLTSARFILQDLCFCCIGMLN
jgi:hypothetical protein